MRAIVIKAIFLFVITGIASTVLAAEWGYTAQNGPAQWGKVGYPLCATGKEQSPVNIAEVRAVSPSELVFQYPPARFKRKKDHHNVYVYASIPSADSVEFHDKQYQLQSFHFHTPSEHEVRGTHYPLEGHFIHKDAAGDVVVVGVFFKLGAANPGLQQFLTQSRQQEMTIDVNQFLPAQKRYYVYPGSLTTPPCTEGLTWVVLAKPITLSAAQLRLFKSRVMFFNARPPQALNQRVIYKAE